MNKKVLAALVTTLAFGTVTVASAGEDAAKAEKPAKAGKGKAKGDAKKGDDTKAAKPIPPPPT